MSILINKETRVIVQGITGRDGGFHTQKMVAYGTKVVGGVSPGKGGLSIEGVPVFNSVKEAVLVTEANTSVIFVPARFAADAIMEAADAGIKLIVCITEGIPTLDVIRAYRYVQLKGSKLLGPNCPGLMTPGESLVGILPANIFKEGRIGVVSRSGTLTYEVVYLLSQQGMGQSTAVGIGGDPVSGIYFLDTLEAFERDSGTDAVVLIGEIGGDAEENAADFIKVKMTKPVVAFIAGRTAPKGKQMGHAGAIVGSGEGTADDKIAYLERAGVSVAKQPSEIPELLRSRLRS